jgi:hypothetical protein
VDEVGEGVEVVVLREEGQWRSIHGSRRVLLWVCVWIVRAERDFVKGVTIQTDSEFFGTERIFFVKFVKYRGISKNLL